MRHSLLRAAGRLLFPDRCPYCGRVIGFLPDCPACREQLSAIRLMGLLTSSLLHAPSLDGAAACYRYANPVKQGILRLKFRGAKSAAAPLGKEMGAFAHAAFAGQEFDFALPVPTTPKQLRRRGYNVPALLGGGVCQILEIPLKNDILIKEYDTPAQHRLPVAQRRANLIGAFAVAGGVDLRDKRLLLVDDVITTGSTLEECAKMLRLAGAAQVWAVTLAASEKISLPQAFSTE